MNKISLIAIIVGLFVSYSSVCSAQERSRPLISDPRIHIVTYQPDIVIPLHTRYFYNTVIEFAKDEETTFINLGDSAAFKATKQGNEVIVSPQIMGKQLSTNMRITTSKERKYNFLLTSSSVNSTSDTTVIYNLKFVYPGDTEEDHKLKRQNEIRGATSKYKIAMRPEDLNFNYSRAGEKGILPTRVFDNGKFTFFEFDKDTPLPAIFLVHPDRSESLVNYETDGKYTIVKRLGPQFTLRHGKTQVACVFNDLQLKEIKLQKRKEQRTQFFNNKQGKVTSSVPSTDKEDGDEQ